MSTIDFVFPERKLFPINKPEDIISAVESFHLFEDELSYYDFSLRLAKLAQKKGSAFINALPNKIKKYTGIRKENNPESILPYKGNSHKRKSRFVHKERYDE